MPINRIIDVFQGDERSKQELKRAYQKAFQLKIILFIILISIFYPLLSYAFSLLFEDFSQHDFLAHLFRIVFPIGFSFMISLILSLFIGNFSMYYLTRHLKISLPESVAPKVEIRHL